MEPEDETNAYLSYLNDAETSHSYLLTNEVGLTDTFPVEQIFTEIDSSDWPTILLSNALPTEDSDGTSNTTDSNIEQKYTKDSCVNGNEANEMVVQTAEENSCIKVIKEPMIDKDNTHQTQITYINYSPIVKEKEDGNKEIYLTEKDINNDAKIIQLLNTDGSIITIDKSVLNSINLPAQQKEKSVLDFFTTVTANKCKLCNALCESLDEVKQHLCLKHPEHFNVNNNERLTENPKKGMVSLLNKNKLNGEIQKEYTIFVCSICKDVCFDKETLREHMVQKHNCRLNTQKEDTNEKETKQKTISSLKALSSFLIKKQQKALKKVPCTVPGCKLLFPTENVKDKHEKCHVEEKKHFKCFECDETFSLWRICKNHLWKTHEIDIGLLVCPMCNNFRAVSSGIVLNHMAIHSEEKPFLCPFCDKGFKTLSQMKNHCAGHGEPNHMPNWSTLKKCDTCHRFFANSKTLKKHIQSVHENFKPFICNICGHKTSRKAMLELHLRQHTGIKPHKCPYCDYRTGDHNCLRKHIMKHVGATQYQCEHCTYTCIQSASLKNHMLHKHPGKSGTYKCKYCSYTSINEAAFAAHEKCHETSAKDIKATTEANDNTIKDTTANDTLQDCEDDETQNCFLNTYHIVEETVDTGGITIPAGYEVKLVS